MIAEDKNCNSKHTQNFLKIKQSTKLNIKWFSSSITFVFSIDAYKAQCRPNADPNIRKVCNVDPMPFFKPSKF